MKLSIIKSAGGGRGECTIRTPMLAFRFRGAKDFTQLTPEKTASLLTEKNMYFPRMTTDAAKKIEAAKEGFEISLGTPLIFVLSEEEMPRTAEATEAECENIFKATFPGSNYFIDGEVQIHGRSSVGNNSHLISGIFPHPRTNEPLLVNIVRSMLGENLLVIDSYIEDCVIQGGMSGIKDVMTTTSFSSSLIKSDLRRSFLSGLFDLTESMIERSFVEVDPVNCEPWMNVFLSRTVVPMGRKLPSDEIAGLMGEEKALADYLEQNPSQLVRIILKFYSQDPVITLGEEFFDRRGRVTSLAAALTELSNKDALFSRILQPAMLEARKTVDTTELSEKLNSIRASFGEEDTQEGLA